MDNQILQAAIQFVIGSVITPLVEWLKGRYIKDLPISSVAICVVISIAIARPIALMMNPTATWMDIVGYVLITQFGAQLSHATIKSKEEIKKDANSQL